MEWVVDQLLDPTAAINVWPTSECLNTLRFWKTREFLRGKALLYIGKKECAWPGESQCRRVSDCGNNCIGRASGEDWDKSMEGLQIQKAQIDSPTCVFVTEYLDTMAKTDAIKKRMYGPLVVNG